VTDWIHRRAQVTQFFDSVADIYRREFADELDGKPFDRDLLDRMSVRLPAAPVLEVGAGPGHVGAFVAHHGHRVIVSDASLGQLRQARLVDDRRPLLVADLARLPMGPASLGGVIAFYCLIYGPADELVAVFADWRRALVPGGLACVAVHAGDGEIHVERWQGRRVDITMALRDPDDMARRLIGQGFAIVEHAVRPPYEDEHQTDRCYVVAQRLGI
jgi:SAM-dependent methyltransferase